MDATIFKLFAFAAFIYSVVLHEVAHGLVAYSMGDSTAKDLGRLTLNPLRHIDLVGSILVPLVFFYLTGFVFGYAKPVPYNPHNLSDRRYGPAKVGLAGPLANIILAVLFGLVLRVVGSQLGDAPAVNLMQYIVWVNLILAVFNLMPIPPLDGHWLALTFVPARLSSVLLGLYRYSYVVLLAFIFFIFPLFVPLVALLFRVITGSPLS